MSRVMFIIALVMSVALHVSLLRLPAAEPADGPRPAIVVPVVETELARLDPPEPQPSPPPVAPPTEPPDEPPPPPPAPSPQPPMVKVADIDKADSAEPGDFAGDPEGRRAPTLRIDWGTDQQALAALEAGEMILAVLDGSGPKPLIKAEVERQGKTWRRRPYQPTGATVFSNRLRIVDHVPAFREVQSALDLRGEERLAVVVPMHVERVLDSAQMEAAFRRGLAMQHIDDFAGSFSLRDGRLAFHITHVRETARSAAP